MSGKDCVKVAVRVRPFNKRERDAGGRCIISMASSTITIQDPRNSQSPRSFCFDYAYWSHSENHIVGFFIYLFANYGGK
uniref:Kinesin motor domain-containing protein n=1 Tax=Hucho hucho TaxID=62062 RepID=A0A4W5QWP3_9TELE